MNTNLGLLPASQETREWCSILEQKITLFPLVKMTHVFGTLAFYHRKVMFAMLPDKRTLEGSASISFLASPKTRNNADPSWQKFELTESNLDEALILLEQAYSLSVLHPFSGYRRFTATLYSVPSKTNSALRSGSSAGQASAMNSLIFLLPDRR
jgi:hypothetical protein